jgi:gentisate 1,2-dioxygenase
MSTENLFERLMEIRDEQRERKKGGRVIVAFKDLEWEDNRQGKMKWYMHPDIKDNALNQFLFWVQEIPPGGRSGKQKSQGGQVAFIWAGKGYTTIDGVRHDWEKDDCLNLPVRTNGIVVQHVNTDPKEPARIMFIEPNLASVLGIDRGCGFEQIEDAPK